MILALRLAIILSLCVWAIAAMFCLHSGACFL